MASDSIVHIVLAANRRYLPGLRATFVSMVNSAKEKRRLRFHIFEEGFTATDREDLSLLGERFGYAEPIDFRTPDMAVIAKRFAAYRGSHTTFLRLFFPEFLPELDFAIWADVDTLWFRDPAELWAMQDARVAIKWSQDLPSIRAGARNYFSKWRQEMDIGRYGCAGVMLMNLERMRELDVTAKCVEFVDKYGTPPFVDQDILNEVCYDDSQLVDVRWDMLNPDPGWRQGVVLHFNGIGPLFNGRFHGWRPLYEIWFRYYAQVVEGRQGAQVCPRWKRAIFDIAGLCCPKRWPIDLVPLSLYRRDQLYRTLFFCWLRRKRLWRNK